MYSNLFYFIIAFTLFVLYESSPNTPGISPSVSLLILIAAVLAVHLWSRAVFKRYVRTCDSVRTTRETDAAGHTSTINRTIAVAVVVYGALLYLGDVKRSLLHIPLVAESSFLLQGLGVLPFLVMLCVIWSAAYPAYRMEIDQGITRAEYVFSHLRLNAVFIVPWLLFALLQDAVQILPAALVEPFRHSGAAVFAVYAVLLGALACLFPAVLVKLWNCQPLPDGERRRHLESVCRKAGVRYADILKWDLFKGRFVTAGVLGLLGRFRYILISPALLNMLSDEELEGVLAHEIGHVHYWHLPFYVLFVLGYGVLFYVVFHAAYAGIIGQDALIDLIMRDDGTFHTAFHILPVVLVGIFLLLYFRYLFGWFSRSFERQADAFAVRVMGRPDTIISSLDRIAGPGTAARTAPNWHHYSIQERMDFLSRCGENPEIIHRHTRKVLRMVAVFIAVIVVAGFAGMRFSSTSLYQQELSFMQKALERRIEHDPVNPLLHFVLANILYEMQQYHQAEMVYKRVIELDSGMHEALNNLAWLYATAENDSLFKPREALELARAASALAPQPHILDTLAEAYFVNGRYREAVAVIQKAMTMNPDDLEYYQGQLEKFQKYIHRDQRQGRGAAQAL